jgi:lysophospholipase L1-like esterase
MRRRAMLAVLLALCLGACSPAATGSAHGGAAATGSPSRSASAVPFGVVGDSLTAGTKPLAGSGQTGVPSWLHGAEGAPLELSGGWALPGATTAQMLAGLQRVDADVLVVLAGTNDLQLAVPWETVRDNLLAIVATAGVPRVVLSTVPPLDRFPAHREQYNRRLRALADEQHWRLVDPWTAVQSDGAWVPGTTIDGVHPTAQVADRAGRAIRAVVLDAAGR